MEAPGFGEFSKEQNDRYLRKIMKSSADIIWVGLGAPKQEKWIYDNFQKFNGRVFVGVGAGFAYLTGQTRHAPDWMKRYALEWMFRLIQEPGRLWKRYLKYNFLFLRLLVRESLGIHGSCPDHRIHRTTGSGESRTNQGTIR
jgi:N-acetylglucosaminyldiphosphoundecaprenol N-acetyl-beta-D-mannosaminyltransferase